MGSSLTAEQRSNNRVHHFKQQNGKLTKKVCPSPSEAGRTWLKQGMTYYYLEISKRHDKSNNRVHHFKQQNGKLAKKVYRYTSVKHIL